MQRKGDSVATFFILFLIVIISFVGGIVFERYIFSQIKSTEKQQCKEEKLSTLKEVNSIPLNKVKNINFTKNSRENAIKLAKLTSTTTSASDLVRLGFCASGNAHINYDPIKDMYGLTCLSGLGRTLITDVKGILPRVCSDSSDYQVKNATVCYKVKR